MIETNRAISWVLLVFVVASVGDATAPKEPRAQEQDSQTAEAASAKSGVRRASQKASDDRGTATRMTPFGQAKTQTTPRPRRSTASMSHLVKVEEQGAIIVFRQRIPFGERVWKKARTELSDQERELLEAHQAAKPRSQEGEDTACVGPMSNGGA